MRVQKHLQAKLAFFGSEPPLSQYQQVNLGGLRFSISLCCIFVSQKFQYASNQIITQLWPHLALSRTISKLLTKKLYHIIQIWVVVSFHKCYTKAIFLEGWHIKTSFFWYTWCTWFETLFSTCTISWHQLQLRFFNFLMPPS